MRKFISMMLSLILVCLAVGGAYAETTFSMAGYDHEDTGHDWSTNLFFERMKERSGVHLELTQYKTADAWKAAKEQMLSGSMALPDAFFKADFTPQETMKWLEAGKIIDLKPYLEQYAPNLWALLNSNPVWMEAVTLPTGEIAALPSIDELQFNNAMWINQTWLNKAGLSVPTTAEELTEVLRVFKSRDMNSNGKTNDEVPLTFSSLWDLRFLGHAFGINANDYHVTIDENGVVSEVLTSDANRALLTWLNQLWEEGLIDETGFSGLRDLSASTSSSSDEDKEVIYGVMFASTPVSLVSNSAMKEYAVLDPLVYEGKQIYRDLTGDIIRGTFAITSACKDPAALVSWVDYLYTEEGFILSEAGVADEEFYWNDDGTWLWDSASDSMISTVLADSTIRSGISMPGYSSIPFQQKIDDASTQFIVNSLLRLKGYDELPYPMVYLTEEQQSRVDELILNISRYAEYQMVWFVAGDVELNDENWQTFCKTVKELGMDEMVSIWQTAADTQR
ncbi:MAG: extracellular solute-binding protein [Clostridia bacterium]|nr:extracellular solute-binding protein [Clostridia bacterium]